MPKIYFKKIEEFLINGLIINGKRFVYCTQFNHENACIVK